MTLAPFNSPQHHFAQRSGHAISPVLSRYLKMRTVSIKSGLRRGVPAFMGSSYNDRMSAASTEPSEEFDRASVEADIQRVCDILASVANSFAPDSAEAIAIRDAAIAYTVVQFHGSMKKSYQRLRIASGSELTDEMKADLRRHGIEPDDLEEDEPEDRNLASI
jgi:hypothetical protein